MKIAHREIGPKQPQLVIAEIGINHGGSLDVAKAMVSAAHKAGCEMVKYQTHFVEDEMIDEAKVIFPPNADVSTYAIHFADFGVAVFHPVTSEADSIGAQAASLFGRLEASGKRFVEILQQASY